MTPSKLATLSWRQTRRDLRAGELNLLIAALMLAVIVSTGVSLLSNQLQITLGRQVTSILGADLVIQGAHPITSEIEQAARDTGIQQVRTIEFPTMLIAGDLFQMVSAKGVEAGYPLRGFIRTATNPFGADQASNTTPAPGEAWLEPRLFSLLDISIGDTITLGNKTLTVTQAITLESDRGKGFYSFSPRLLFNLTDLSETGLVQPGSRVAWRNLYAGSEQAIAQFRALLTDQMTAEYRLLSIEEGNQGISRSLQRVTVFLALSAQLALLLAGIAIAMAAQRFVRRRYDTIAIFRCLGASRKDAVLITALQLLWVLLFILPPALLLGWLLNTGITTILSDLLPTWMPAVDMQSLLTGALSGTVILLGFAIAPLLQLSKVTPLRVLKKEIIPAPVASGLIYSTAIISLIGIAWYLTGNLLLSVSLTIGTGVVLSLLAFCLLLLYWLFNHVLKDHSVALIWRIAFRHLTRQRSIAIAQLMAFSLTLMVMVVAFQVRTDLVERWQAQLPENAPNYFTLNIQSHERNKLSAFLTTRDINTSQMHPIVRGRLIEINNQPIDHFLNSDQQRDPAVNRALNITWSEKIPTTNKLIAGQWWHANSRDEVSVESGLAERLGLELGDKLTFSIAGKPLTVTITSMRQVEWENFQPNFYIVTPKAALIDYPATWLNSFYLPDEQRQQLNSLIRTFPSLSLIEMNTVINQARTMIEQGTIALEVMLLVLLIAGLLVLWASINSTKDERIQESALLRALGCQSRQLQRLQTGEFIILGSLSGMIAAIGSEFCNWLIFSRVLGLHWQPSPLVWLLLPVTGALLISAAGYIGSLPIVQASPLKLLKASG